ncbi:O-antigen ligase family protein [Candidatus Kaiserbacteria bacterium]|nr:O-antigen ligase family protein [Candidatus Kaiserbacteria bacterium]
MARMTLEKVLRWIALIGIFALPFIVLVVSRSLFFPFITGKNFTFRILVEIVGTAWLALAFVKDVYRPKRSWILLAFAAFVVAIGISDMFGVNAFKSFWSNYERMEGWVTLAHLLVYLTASVSILSTEGLWKRWWQVSLGVSAFVAFYGLLQLAGFITINQGGVRLDATLGNATYLAVYMLFHIFIAALFLARAWIEKPNERPMSAFLYGGLIFLDSLILFFTATRGAILGLIGGALLSAVILIILAPRSRVAWRAGSLIAALVVLIGVFWVGRDSAFVQGVEPLQRLASISLSDVKSNSRYLNINMAWQGFKERPILGWGQENYAVVFDKYYDPKMYAQEPWFDRVHNIVFDWLIAGGIVGLILYAAIFFAALISVWKKGKDGAFFFAPYERAILTGLFAAYGFHNLFVFDNIVSYVLFVSLLGYIAVRSSEGSVLLHQRMVKENALPLVSAGAVVLLWGIAMFVNADALAANKAIIRGLSGQEEGPSKNLEYFKEAISYGTYGTQEAREHLSQIASQIGANAGLPQDVRLAFLQIASDEMGKQMQEAPLNARFPFFLGILLDSFGSHDNASGALQKAHQLSPTKQSIFFQLGMNSLARNQSEEALQYFKDAYELEPNYGEARVFYAAVAIHVGDAAVENEMMNVLLEKGGALDPRILSAYAAKGRYDKIAQVAAAYIGTHPNDLQPRLTYAAALYKMGDRERAIEALQELKLAVPASAAQADALIAEIRAGTLQIQ